MDIPPAPGHNTHPKRPSQAPNTGHVRPVRWRGLTLTCNLPRDLQQAVVSALRRRRKRRQVGLGPGAAGLGWQQQRHLLGLDGGAAAGLRAAPREGSAGAGWGREGWERVQVGSGGQGEGSYTRTQRMGPIVMSTQPAKPGLHKG